MQKKALIVVDFQNDFVNGSLGFDKAINIEQIICDKIQSYKNNGDSVIFTFDTHYDDYLESVEGKNLPVLHCIYGTDGHKLYGKVADFFDENSVYFNKTTFGSLELANYLKENEYTQIELVGLVSNICVLTNAILIKSALPNSEIIVDYNATTSFDEEMNEKAMDILEGVHIKVTR